MTTNVLGSSDVSSGQPTAAAQFNALRADALRFGAAAADASTHAALLQRYMVNFNLVLLGTNRVRCVAAPSQVVAMVVDGYPLISTANVDLPVGSAPSGSANTYYVFAVHTAGSQSFSLDCNTSSVESVNRRCVGHFYWDGGKIVQNSILTVDRDFIVTTLNQGQADICQGRLTLVSGVAVTPADQTNGTVYYTPYTGNSIGLFVLGTGWRVYDFTEISISLAGVASGKNVDIFVYDNQGVVTLDKAVWASDSARATQLGYQDGILVMYNTPDRRYVGTIRTSSAATAEDSVLRRFVWNLRNRLPRKLFVTEATATWSYSLLAYHQANANANNQVQVVVGIQESTLNLVCGALGKNSSSANFQLGIGEDSTTVSVADTAPIGVTATWIWLAAQLLRMPTIGYHAYNWLERALATGTTSWTSVTGDPWTLGSGLIGTIDA